MNETMNEASLARYRDVGDSMIRTRGLHKRYGGVIALNGLDLFVPLSVKRFQNTSK